MSARGGAKRAIQMFLDTVLRLNSGAMSKPALDLAEVAASFLSVLALRDTILRGALPSNEVSCAAGLWAGLFVAFACLARREVRHEDK